MAEKIYDWVNGAELQKHTRCKLDILREYFYQYLRVKCSPLVRHFRIAIVDGFAGGGIYKDGTFGSPLIFLQELEKFSKENNIWRRDQGLPELSIECMFIVNEINSDANKSLDNQLEIWEQDNDIPKEHFNVKIQKLQKPFLEAYPQIKQILWNRRFQNVLFNIDPCGYTDFNFTTLQDIMNSFKSAEVFYTFMIGALLQYTSWQNLIKTEQKIEKLGVPVDAFLKDSTLWKKSEWLATAEIIIHKELSSTAAFVSPFAINQAGSVGYNYWLLHFANNYRAREVYNDVLHGNARGAAHFGKSGLRMLEYTPEEASLFDFSEMARNDSIQKLHSDIPKFISEFGDAISVDNFRSAIYNGTPAHSDNINSVLIKNSDIEVLTDKGVPRRSAKTIMNADIIRLNKQKSFYSYFSSSDNDNKNKTD